LAAGERTVILAEGFSGDPHYGKTMRGVLRYRRDDVVVIVDSRRAGETEAGVPIVADVDSALSFGPEVAIVGVATQGGRFPPAWRAILRRSIDAGLSIENGLHEMLGDDLELRLLADVAGVELRDLRRPPPGLDVATGANLVGHRGDRIVEGGSEPPRERPAGNEQAHFRVEQRRARVEVERAHEDARLVGRERLRVKARIRGALLLARLARPVLHRALHLVKAHARARQLAASLGVAGMHHRDVGGGIGIGQHADANAFPREALQHRRAFFRRHEVGRDDVEAPARPLARIVKTVF